MGRADGTGHKVLDGRHIKGRRVGFFRNRFLDPQVLFLCVGHIRVLGLFRIDFNGHAGCRFPAKSLGPHGPYGMADGIRLHMDLAGYIQIG
ncbi:unknown [Acidaminococcus intestini CAG:325]|nr:unknown [Acidaminococcus intestini CAG:325]